jgi:two-component system, chemotaxis family, sensor kinase Cph1
MSDTRAPSSSNALANEGGPFVVDLTNCDREPIHIPGSVQPHCALLAVDPKTLRFDAFLYRSGEALVVELAPAGEPLLQDALALVQATLSRVQQARTQLFCQGLGAERQRIARELHDSLGQTLTLLKLGLDEPSQALPDSGQAKERLAALKALADGVGSEVNRLAWEIRPTALDDLGLETALRHLVEAWSERLSLRFDPRLAHHDRRLNPTLETTRYPVLQEAIADIARHAGATRVAELLEVREKEVSMIVEDNGRGFSDAEPPPAGAPSGRLGLLGIRERLSLVSGAIEVESAPSQGCTLYIRAPL